uniref:Anthocyanin acyltransferase n=1 Tax=Solanum tuberosum TaxID=4113 RepID=M1DW46_SOLTU
MEIRFLNQKDCIKVEILWTKLIKPTPPHLQRYKLSFFDQLSEKEHVTLVLFYANNNFINNSTIDERLEQSLSKVLAHVYPAAGRYDKDECLILCLDQGVSYTKAKVNWETKMELHNFIILIRDMVNKVAASCAKASPDEIVSTLVNIYNESVRSPEWGGNDEVDKVLCSSMCNFPLHDTEFGLGKPALLFFGAKDTQMF